MLLLGFVLSALIAAASVRFRLLTPDGAAAAVLIGTLVFGFGGWGHATILAIFFVSSSVLTRWKRERKMHSEHRTGRTAAQVFANGMVAAGLAVAWGQSHSPGVAAAFTAAVAASTADTWATEVGLLSPRPPRMITTWKVVRAGASGGVTSLGTAAAIVGAGLIAGSAWLLDVPGWIPWITGFGAMLLDSVLGATLEERVRGVTNDTVNVLATLGAAAAAALLI
ncbi:MAG TPA: DUF92 domain-containing protein [bacterium]|nr:DUF92 domain-containing protein [bacterium]